MDNNTTTLFEKYKKELEIDTIIDEINVKEVQMKLPAIKHKWVARLIQAKADLKKLQSIRSAAVNQLKKQISPPVDIPDTNKAKAASKQSIVQKIDEEISQQELIIDYLTRVEVIMRNMSFDLSNLVRILTLETT